VRVKDSIIVLGLVGQYPVAGIAWQLLHHLVGFERLGFEVFYIEETGVPPYDPRTKDFARDCFDSLRFIDETLRPYGFADHWAYRDGLTNQWRGLSDSRVRELFDQALCVVNLCGASHPEILTYRPKGKFIYLETDPVLYQVRLAQEDAAALNFVGGHDAHVTYGENLGASDCPVPLTHFDWKKTRPPVVVDLWTTPSRDSCRNFTTIATWHNRGKDMHFRGETYLWSKHHNFLKIVDLPQRVSQAIELGVEIDDQVELETVQRYGWILTNPLTVSHDMQKYQTYIINSRGEFTVAKDVVARTKSGWFSDRSVCYLAAGKPVITQETGFSKYLPTGHGLFGFSSTEEAAAAFDSINSDYLSHAQAAQEIAREFFSAEKLLGKLLVDAGV